MRGLVWRNRAHRNCRRNAYGPWQPLFYLVVEFGYVFLDQDVGAIALLAVAVVDQRIIEGVHMSGCLPYSGMHENRGINTYDIFMKKGHGVPPIPFDIIFRLHAVLTIVINGRQTIVNFA